jgi:hypothetical protein
VVVVVVVTVGVVCVVVVDPSSFVTVELVELPVAEDEVEPLVIEFESTPPALEYEEGRNTKEHTNNPDNNSAGNIHTRTWSFCNPFFI